MSIKSSERLLITYRHSNPQTIISGYVVDLAGEIIIDWKTYNNVVFVKIPLLLALYPDGVATGKTAQPICYHVAWIRDVNGAYTGMKIYSSGSGSVIHWAVRGIVQR